MKFKKKKNQSNSFLKNSSFCSKAINSSLKNLHISPRNRRLQLFNKHNLKRETSNEYFTKNIQRKNSKKIILSSRNSSLLSRKNASIKSSTRRGSIKVTQKSILQKQLTAIKFKKSILDKKHSLAIPSPLNAEKRLLTDGRPSLLLLKNQSKIEISQFCEIDENKENFDMENLRQQAALNVYGQP